MLAQIVDNGTSSGTSSASTPPIVIVIAIVVALLLTSIPAFKARSMGRSFWLWWLFGGVGVFPAFLLLRVLGPAPVREPLGTAELAHYRAEHPDRDPLVTGLSHSVVSDAAIANASWDTPPASQPGAASTPTPVVAPAGWYPAPGDATRERYWDGSNWTDQER